jgi:hypothetical protein
MLWATYVKEFEPASQPVECGRFTFGFVLRDKGHAPWSITDEELAGYQPDKTK